MCYDYLDCSLFIELRGRTKNQAFTLGQEIADAVTADNPSPIKLKFEKVIQCCLGPDSI